MLRRLLAVRRVVRVLALVTGLAGVAVMVLAIAGMLPDGFMQRWRPMILAIMGFSGLLWGWVEVLLLGSDPEGLLALGSGRAPRFRPTIITLASTLLAWESLEWYEAIRGLEEDAWLDRKIAIGIGCWYLVAAVAAIDVWRHRRTRSRLGRWRLATVACGGLAAFLAAEGIGGRAHSLLGIRAPWWVPLGLGLVTLVLGMTRWVSLSGWDDVHDMAQDAVDAARQAPSAPR